MLNLSQYLKANESELTEPIYSISLWHQTAMESYFLSRKLIKTQSKIYSSNLIVE